MDLVDTIAALATPPGRGAVAVVRLSGPGTQAIVKAVVPGIEALEPRRVRLVHLRHPSSREPLDHGLLTWFPGPASYTGEDVAEFSLHGGPLTARLVVEALRIAGARVAEPGEFTRRAYLNGKIDLVQAEAVGDLVEGTSLALHREALRQLDRHLSRRISSLRDRILDLEAVLAHHIDFPEEDDPPVSSAEIARRAVRLADELETLAATAPEGERLREGALVVLAGRPNAGKSSLYNALLGEERALVTEVPGTTRDALEADVSMDGYPIRLVDTAGLRDSEGVVERLGIEVALRFVGHADLVLHCVPADADVDPEEVAWSETLTAPVLRVRTMADRTRGGAAGDGGGAGCLAAAEGVEEEGPGDGGSEDRGSGPWLAVSAVTGSGLDRLRATVAERVFSRLRAAPDDAPVLTRRRQADSVERAAVEVRAFAQALDEAVPVEYASTHLKTAESALEEVVGLVETEDVLDRLFRSFCVGK